MLRAILNKSWWQYPTRHQLYGHLPPITKTIRVGRTRQAGYCWRSREELISDVHLWTPTYGRAKAGRPARTYIQQLCGDRRCSPEYLPGAMNDGEKWRERVRDICVRHDISLTLSPHSFLSFIALGRSSGQHPVSSHSCWMYVRAGRPAFARPCVGIHKSTSLMSSSLLLQQCPACLVRLTWIVFAIGGRWPYSWCLVGCCCQDLFRIARSHLASSPVVLLASM